MPFWSRKRVPKTGWVTADQDCVIITISKRVIDNGVLLGELGSLDGFGGVPTIELPTRLCKRITSLFCDATMRADFSPTDIPDHEPGP